MKLLFLPTTLWFDTVSAKMLLSTRIYYEVDKASVVTESIESATNILSTVKEVMKSEDSERWMKVMRFGTEISAKMNTWDPAELSLGKKIIKAK